MDSEGRPTTRTNNVRSSKKQTINCRWISSCQSSRRLVKFSSFHWSNSLQANSSWERICGKLGRFLGLGHLKWKSPDTLNLLFNNWTSSRLVLGNTSVYPKLLPATLETQHHNSKWNKLRTYQQRFMSTRNSVGQAVGMGRQKRLLAIP